jgi:hypothetical protein
LSDLKSVLYLQPLRAISSVGSEHLVYTERVGGSNPSLPTSITILMNFSSGFFVFKKIRSSLLDFFKNKKDAMSAAHKDCICSSGFNRGSVIPHCRQMRVKVLQKCKTFFYSRLSQIYLCKVLNKKRN